MSLAGRALSAFRRDGLSGVLHGLRWRAQRLLGGGGLLGALGGGLRLLVRGGPRAFASRVRWGLASGGPVAETPPHPFTTSQAFHSAFNPLFDLDAEVLAENWAITGQFERRPTSVTSATWFITYFDHALFGGVHTILRLMDFMAARGVANRIVIFDRPSATDAEIRAAITTVFPGLSGVDIVITKGAIDYDELPWTDIAIGTMWISAYPLARFQSTAAKFYMVQDYEPTFYPAGTLSALAEATYRLGFAGIVNTPGLADVYRAFGNPTISFMPAVAPVDSPPEAKPSAKEDGRVQVVLYGRPGTDRNAFELVAAAAVQVKQKHGSAVHIVSAGEDWEPADVGLGGVVENRGRLTGLDAVRQLYAESDIGICFMLSKHPSYQPFEYLAAHVAPICNRNEATEWMLKNEHNCLVVEPFPSEISAAVGRLIEDPELRREIAGRGFDEVTARAWDQELTTIWSFITND